MAAMRICRKADCALRTWIPQGCFRVTSLRSAGLLIAGTSAENGHRESSGLPVSVKATGRTHFKGQNCASIQRGNEALAPLLLESSILFHVRGLRAIFTHAIYCWFQKQSVPVLRDCHLLSERTSKLPCHCRTSFRRSSLDRTLLQALASRIRKSERSTTHLCNCTV